MRQNFEKIMSSGMKRKSRGFSLMAVLIISMIAISLTASAVSIVTASSGAGRRASAKNVRYNILQNGIERGKAELKKMALNSSEIPRYTDMHGGTEPDEINGVEDLLIKDGAVVSETLTGAQLGKLGLEGQSAVLTVRIYDMQYDPDILSDTISPEDMKNFPPSLMVSGGAGLSEGTPLDADEDGVSSGEPAANAGAYLIRASIVIGGRTSTLDTAVIQANKS